MVEENRALKDEIERLTAQLAESRGFHLFWETYARLVEPFVNESLRATATKIARTWKRWKLGPDEPPAPKEGDD